MLYAHAVVEDPRDGAKYERGDVVPDDLPGIDELTEHGSVSSDPYAESDDREISTGDAAAAEDSR